MLAIEMSKGKMDLADPDRDHARLIFLLTCREHYRNENSRLILKQLLKTVQAHPGGQTAQARASWRWGPRNNSSTLSAIQPISAD
jgi:hypothetical protein